MTRMRSLAFASVLIACSRNPAPDPAPPPGPQPGDAARVTFLHINDIYEISPIEAGKSGGLARVATILRRLERENPNTRMVLAGDFVSPSAIGTARVDGQRLAGRQMVAVLNAVGLDLTVLGNHEFDISEAELGRRIAESRFAYVNTNVTDSLGHSLLGLPTHHIFRFTDASGRTARIGIVGLTVDQARRPNLRYRGYSESVREEIAKLEDSVDALIALTHLRLQDDAELADQVPELDLILGGHEHENWIIRRGRRWTPIIKADANVRTIAIVDIAVRPGTRATATWRLIPITDSIPEDAAVAAEVTRWTTLAYDAFRREGLNPEQVVVTVPVALDAREAVIRNQENDFTRLLTRAWLTEVPGAEVAIANAGSVRLDDVLQPGPVTEYDVIRLLPFGGKVVEAEFTGALLRQVVEQGDANRGIGGFLLRTGIDQSDEGWRIAGAPLDPARTYRVAINDFLLTGLEQNLAYLKDGNPGLKVVRTHRDVRLVLMDELRKRFAP